MAEVAASRASLLAAPARPLLRGMLHLAALFAAITGAVALLLLAESARDYVSSAVFSTSLILLYGTSAVYHRVTWSAYGRGLMRRLDHAMIFVLIAGTYTPFCLLVMGNAWGISILSVIWSVAGAGILMKLAWPHAPRWLGVSIYFIVGWLALVPSLELIAELAARPLALTAFGGVLYSIGGVIYALRRPDPWPRVFGYHEVFHLLVIAGGALHYVVVGKYLIV